MSSVSLSQNVNVGRTLNVLGSSSHTTGKGSKENRARKGKDREKPEQNMRLDSSKAGEADPEPESPDINRTRFHLTLFLICMGLLTRNWATAPFSTVCEASDSSNPSNPGRPRLSSVSS